MSRIGKIVVLIITLLVIFIFRSWFSLESLSTGDWTFKFPQAISSSPLYFYAWDANFSNGMGNNITFLLPLSTYAQLAPAILLKLAGFEWNISEKIVWYFPFLLLSLIGSFVFFKKIIINNNALAALSVLIFTTNTYILMTIGGGQIGVGVAYSLIPLVLFGFANILKNLASKQIIAISIVAGILYSVQLMIDPRIGYISLFIVGIYYIIFLLSNNFFKSLKETLVSFLIVPGIVIVFLNFFWIVPFVLTGQNPLSNLGESYTNQGMVDYLSFARLENTISLLHPNWPENIFGKTHFMRPEFLLIPLIGFLSLILLNTRNLLEKRIVLTFLAIGILGIFLAKGSTAPFGNIYLWLFNNIPGFLMFRDPTKWYGLIAVAYSVLIPYSIFLLSKLIKIKSKPLNQEILILIFIVIWGLLIHQTFTGGLTGTFTSRSIPGNYVDLANYLIKDKDYYRTLWVPNFTPYSYYSPTNPIIPARALYEIYDNKKLVNQVSLDRRLVDLSSVKYIVVPDDINNQIFVNDGNPDIVLYENTINSLRKSSFLEEKSKFGKLVLFEVKQPKSRFYIFNSGSENIDAKIKYQYINPVEYRINIEGGRRGDSVIFSENYDPGWVAVDGDMVIGSAVYKNKINSFILPRDGNYNLKVYYKPQDWVNKGIIVSLSAFVVIILFLIINLAKRDRK